jgi:hypothetical protein
VYIAVYPWICRGGPVLLADKWEFINVWTIRFRWWDRGNLKLWNGGGFPFSGVHGFQSVLYCGVRSQDTLSLNEVAKVDAPENGGCKSEAKSRGCWCDRICVFLLQDLKSNVQLVKFCTHAMFQSTMIKKNSWHGFDP